MEINFKFSLNERAITIFGSRGIIKMMVHDHSGNSYYVILKDHSGWFREEHLRSE